MPQATLPVRSSDPDTSEAAAEQATKRAPVIRDVVLAIIQDEGPLTHDQLIAEYHTRVVMDPDTPRASDSGIRARLSELKHSGLVVQDEEEGRSSFGNRAKRWIAVDPDDPRFADDQETAAAAAYIDDEDIVGFLPADVTNTTDHED